MVAVFRRRQGQAPHTAAPSPPPLATGGLPASALWVLSEGDGMRVCKCRRAFVSGFHRSQRSSDVMSHVYEAAESLGSCSLSLNSKINMYLPHTPRPQATCTRFSTDLSTASHSLHSLSLEWRNRDKHITLSPVGEEATAGIKLQ